MDRSVKTTGGENDDETGTGPVLVESYRFLGSSRCGRVRKCESDLSFEFPPLNLLCSLRSHCQTAELRWLVPRQPAQPEAPNKKTVLFSDRDDASELELVRSVRDRFRVDLRSIIAIVIAIVILDDISIDIDIDGCQRRR